MANPQLPGATYRGVQIDKDGTGNVFSASSLSEEGLVGAAVLSVRVGVGAAIGQETVLKQVAVTSPSVWYLRW